MKALGDMSWPHFKPTENLHATRSNPSLKASSTVYIQPERVNRSDLSSRISPEGAYGSEEPIRELLPRLETNSGTFTPEPAPRIPKPKDEISIPTLESRLGTLVPEFDSKGLKPSTSTEGLNKPEVVFPAGSGDEKENIVGTFDAQLPSSPSLSANRISASLKGHQLAVTAMGLRGSGTISPLSDGSIYARLTSVRTALWSNTSRLQVENFEANKSY
jgi:hypothetical protein